MFVKECQAITKIYLVFQGTNSPSPPVQTIISLCCRQLGNSTLLIGLPGTVSNGLMPGSQKYSPKCHRLFKRIRCFLRNVKQFQKNYLFLLLLDKFSGSLIRSVEFIGVDNRAILWYAQARRICPLKNQINFWKVRENF